LSTVLRYVVLVLSAAVMVVGILIVAGILAPRYFSEERFRIVIGAVVFLYGAYRFVVTFYRGRGLNRDDEE
jgi:positive regulator of sigma E activity